MNPFYLPIELRSTIRQDLLDYAKAADLREWVSYYSFAALPVPDAFIEEDPVLNALRRSGLSFKAGVLRMSPNTCYNWHVDTDRRVGVNLLLQHGTSHCLFQNGEFGLTMSVHELIYQPDTYYVFNTQVLHTVINLTGYRYLLSLEFTDKDAGLTYEALCAMIQEPRA